MTEVTEEDLRREPSVEVWANHYLGIWRYIVFYHLGGIVSYYAAHSKEHADDIINTQSVRGGLQAAVYRSVGSFTRAVRADARRSMGG